MRFLYLFAVLLPFFVASQNSHMTLESTYTFTGQTLSNIWGYSTGGNEYALVGAQNGLSILNITNPAAPVFITQVGGAASSSWREVKTYSHYAYVVSEHGSNGCQIVDLSSLPSTNLTWHNYNGNGAAAGLTKAHALQVDEAKGYLYLYGTNLFSGKALCFNLNPDPYNPTYVGKFDGAGYTHDGYANNDTLYPAHIYAGTFAVVNMSNKGMPDWLGSTTTPGAYPHNTWRSGNAVFATDEVNGSFLSAHNITNPASISLLDKIQMNPGSSAPVHNTYVTNSYAVTSWYRDGVAIVDVSRPSNMVVTGSFDTYTCGAGSGWDGCWGVYPFFPSGAIITSNIQGCAGTGGEMKVFTPDYVRGCYLEGAVTNAANDQPLSAVAVSIVGTSTGDNTNAIGLYKIGQVENGTFTAKFVKSGFVTQQIPVTLTNGVLTTLNVALVATPAPIELTRFTARAEGHDAVLTWETASESGNAGFEVQHRLETSDWGNIGYVPAKKNAATGAAYEFRVANLPSDEHFFRLQQNDLDGALALSEQRSVRIAGESFHAALRSNPARGSECTLDVFLEKAATLQIDIFNVMGQKMSDTKRHDLEAGASALSIQIGALPSGAYQMILQTEQKTRTVPLIVAE